MKILFHFSLLLLFPLILKSQDLSSSSPEAFKRGEELMYRIYFESQITGQIDAGNAHMIITDEKKQIAGNPTYHIIVKGRTIGAINLFFKVKDRFESYVDETNLYPYLFIRKAYESGYTADESITFDRDNSIAYYFNNKNSKQKIVRTSKTTHDFVSAYYFARTMDVSNLKEGEYFQMEFVFEDSIYTTRIFYQGKEKVSTLLGTFNCLVFKPKVIVGNVFDEEYPLTVWITDDKNRIPLVVESRIIVGFVKLELFSYKNLSHNLDSFVK